MPSQPNPISRGIALCSWPWSFRNKQEDNGNAHNDAVLDSVGCYACSRVSIPLTFHSTSCDARSQPEWEASAGSSLAPIKFRIPGNPTRVRPKSGLFGEILDPRSKAAVRWNRAFLLARGLALAVDPFFFYAISVTISGDCPPCFYVDGGFAIHVTVLRTSFDMMHVWHVWMQLRTAYVSKESLVIGCGKLVWDARAVAARYLRSIMGFWFDAFVILPIPQIVFWWSVPKLVREEKTEHIMTILLPIFLFHFLPKFYHIICLMRRMQKVTGYLFSTIWWGFVLNLIAYFIASHVVGGCWYGLAVRRVAYCLKQECERRGNCSLSLSCSSEIGYQFLLPSRDSTMVIQTPMCLDVDGPFSYGIYQTALPVISGHTLAIKILYPIYWGLINLSTYANVLEPTSHLSEVLFSIFVVVSGLLLFTLQCANIQVFLQVVMAGKRKMRLRCRDMEWWMSRRQLPSRLRQRVRRYERQRWIVSGGEDEMGLINDLPEGLKRDIKRHLCLDMIKKVPLFHNLDDLILDNICNRVTPFVFSKNEKIIREGDPVKRMIFIVRGRVRRTQTLSHGTLTTSVLEAGCFLGDELLSWCLRRPFIDRIPASTATFVCINSIEAFCLESSGLRYITDHFGYQFANDTLKWTARYYSSNWRTWAAMNIQLAWRRYRARAQSVPGSSVVASSGGNDEQRRLMQYAAMFMSIRPHDHIE